MAALTVAATAQPGNVPPRVAVTVTDSGTPAINSVTVTRANADGTTSVVRTGDGNPLQLTTSGSNRVGTVYDYEAAYGTAVSYSTVEAPTTASAQVTVAVSSVWLVHVGVPARSMPVDFRADSFVEESRAVTAGVFWPMGRRNAVVVTDGQRKGGVGSFTLAIDTASDLAALQALVDDAGVLLLNVPTSLGYGIDTCYVSVQDIRTRRLSTVGADGARSVECPYVTVDAPVGGSQATYAYSDVLARYTTYAALRSGNTTYAQVLAPTS